MRYSTNSENQNVRLSYFRAFACIGIVLLHTTFTSRMLYADYISERQIFVSDTICNMLMWCVPGFIMVTGILLLNPERKVTLKKAVKKYAWRILKALLIFQIVYKLIDTVIANENITVGTFASIFENFITAGGTSLLWYLYMLIGMYLMIPFFKKIVDSSTNHELNMLMVIMLAFLSVMPLSEIFGYKIGFYIPVYTVYPCYLFLGYMIYRKTFAISRMSGWILLLVNSAVIIGTSIYASNGSNLDLGSLWSYSSIFIVLQSVGICELFVDSDRKLPNILNRVVLDFDKCSFGIYLIHIIFVKMILKNYGFNPYENGGFIAIVALVICITAASYIITKAFKLIPIVKNII